MMLAGGVVGAGIGFLRSPEAAGALTALCLPLAGIAASIERLSYYRKPKFPNTLKSISSPVGTTMRQREKNKAEHEQAVARELLDKLGAKPTNERAGNPDKNEPDRIFAIDNTVVGIEVTTAYYDEQEARAAAEIAEKPLAVEEPRFGDVMGGPDNSICESIQERLDEKCMKTYAGADEIWLCINVDGGLTETRFLEECIEHLEVPANPFGRIYVSYRKTENEGGQLGVLEVPTTKT